MISHTQRLRGFSLVELMISLVIGLIVVLVMTQVFLNSEGQKRTAISGIDAQTAATISLYTMERDIAMAGYAINHAAFQGCDSVVGAYGALGNLFPVQIVDGATGSDSVVVTRGDTTSSGNPTRLEMAMSSSQTELQLSNPAGCTDDGVVVVSDGNACTAMRITGIDWDTAKLQYSDAGGAAPTYASGSRALCLSKGIVRHVYQVSNGKLVLSSPSDPAGKNLAADVVFLKAQYGISADVDSDQVANWVSATGAWANPAASVRARIKAIRLAIVTRSAQPEKDEVSGPCTTSGGQTVNAGPCLWEDTASDPAPAVDLAYLDPADKPGDWKHYRYKVHSTIVVPRNLMWKPPT